MAKSTKVKLRNACALGATLVVALFVYGMTGIKSTLRVTKVKNDVVVEFAHTPNKDARWIYFSGNSPVTTEGSLDQSDGENCAIIHRRVWRNVPKVGILEVRIDVRDSQNNVMETLVKSIIMGPEEEP
jgi:hypothetical protein